MELSQSWILVVYLCDALFVVVHHLSVLFSPLLLLKVVTRTVQRLMLELDFDCRQSMSQVDVDLDLGHSGAGTGACVGLFDAHQSVLSVFGEEFHCGKDFRRIHDNGQSQEISLGDFE